MHCRILTAESIGYFGNLCRQSMRLLPRKSVQLKPWSDKQIPADVGGYSSSAEQKKNGVRGIQPGNMKDFINAARDIASVSQARISLSLVVCFRCLMFSSSSLPASVMQNFERSLISVLGSDAWGSGSIKPLSSRYLKCGTKICADWLQITARSLTLKDVRFAK